MDLEDAMNGRGLTEQDCLDPVSYTHLDVYKRQLFPFPHMMFQPDMPD